MMVAAAINSVGVDPFSKVTLSEAESESDELEDESNDGSDFKKEPS